MCLTWPETFYYIAATTMQLRSYRWRDGEIYSRTDMMKLTVSLHSFVVSSKNITFLQEISIDLQALIHISILNFYFILYLSSVTNNALTGLIRFRLAKKLKPDSCQSKQCDFGFQ